MSEIKITTSKFWDYLSRLLEFEAPLHNWRMVLGDQIDFEKFRKTFLIPTDYFAETIVCPKPCEKACPRRVIEQYHNGGYEAVCRKWENDYFAVSEQDILIHAVKDSTLLPAVSAGLGIPPDIVPFRTITHAWKLGVLPIRNTRGIPVFFTLRNRDHEVIDLILNLNRMVDGRYLLVGSSRKVLYQISEGCLADHGAKFIPLNETLDFNCDSELALMHPLDLAGMFAPPGSELETEPENIFRKCGESWEIRFQGGEQFMLNSADTGATYLYFMLSRPNTMTTVVEIVRGFSGESGGYKVDSLLNSEGILDGYALIDLPMTGADDIADGKAIRQYRQEAELLLGEIDKAKVNGDNIILEQLQQDLEKLTKVINQTVSPSGQKKRFADQMRKLVDAFRKSVSFAIDKIAVHDPALADHLHRTIRYGQGPGYFSDNNINWEL